MASNESEKRLGRFHYCRSHGNEDNETDRKLRPTTIADLNDDCLREVFQHMDLDGLVTAADVCYRFRRIAQAHFAAKGDKKLDFEKALRARYFVSAECDLLWASKTLRNFGEFFNSIRVFQSRSEVENRILALIARYCKDGNLIELSLNGSHLTADVQENLQFLLPQIQKLHWDGPMSKELCLYKLNTSRMLS